MDANSDNKIDFEEFRSYMNASKKFRHLGLTQLNQNFHAIDADGNGTLSFDEFFQFTLYMER